MSTAAVSVMNKNEPRRGSGPDFSIAARESAIDRIFQGATMFFALLVLAIRLLRSPGLRGWGSLLGLLLVAQVTL